MKNPSWEESAARRARIRGCLLGGAIGDALGNPVEFLSLDGIRSTHGPKGVTGPVPVGGGVVGQITDDTQMTLFTTEGLIRAHARYMSYGLGGAEVQLVREAYLRWLDTQNHPSPPPPAEGLHHRDGWLREQPWLYARRAPGNACLSGLQAGHAPNSWAEITGAPGPVNPDSKGCGTVMRSAPFGLLGLDAATAFAWAARCAQITHGHPTGYYAAGTFAAITGHLLDGESMEGAVLRAMRLLARHPGHEETWGAVGRIGRANAPAPSTASAIGGTRPTSSPEKGWPTRRPPRGHVREKAQVTGFRRAGVTADNARGRRTRRPCWSQFSTGGCDQH
jgi:ADP-ribosylglycohydrolase